VLFNMTLRCSKWLYHAIVQWAGLPAGMSAYVSAGRF